MLRAPHFLEPSATKFPFHSPAFSTHTAATAAAAGAPSCTASSVILKLSRQALACCNRQDRFGKSGDRVKHRIMANAYGLSSAQEDAIEEEASQVSETSPSWTTFPGQAFPLGVSEVDSGINFAIFSQHSTAVALCLSLPERADGGMVQFALDPQVNKTGDIWHICIKDLPWSNVHYGYRADGPQDSLEIPAKSFLNFLEPMILTAYLLTGERTISFQIYLRKVLLSMK